MMDRFKSKDNDNEWLPISDLMSVLMMVFIIISVFYMLQVKKDKDQIEEIAVTFDKLQKGLYQDLEKEFKTHNCLRAALIDFRTLPAEDFLDKYED